MVNEMMAVKPDTELERIQLNMDFYDFEKGIKAFRKLCVNPKSKDEKLLYATYKSLLNNGNQVFGHANEYFLKSLFLYLSSGFEDAKVFPSHFIKKMRPFIVLDRLQMQRIIYTLYDADRDGTVSIVDILHVKNSVPPDTQFGIEAKKLVEDYYKQCIVKDTVFDYKMFEKLLPASCIGSEILVSY